MSAFQFLVMVVIPVGGVCVLGIQTIFEVAKQRARIDRLEKALKAHLARGDKQ